MNKYSEGQKRRQARERVESGVSKRNEEIYKKYISEQRPTLKELSKEYGISYQRIGEIIKLFFERRPRKLRVKKTQEERQQEKFEKRKRKFISLCKESLFGCIEWQGARNNVTGYGHFVFLGEQSTHRVAWVMKHGEIKNGLFVLHKCDNPLCVNTDHLYLGTQKQNVDDRELRFRGISPKDRKNNIPRRNPEYTGVPQ